MQFCLDEHIGVSSFSDPVGAETKGKRCRHDGTSRTPGTPGEAGNLPSLACKQDDPPVIFADRRTPQDQRREAQKIIIHRKKSM